MKPFSIYLHIPYCLQKCPYCDFNTYALLDIPERDYVAALLSELDSAARKPEWQGREVHTIYFGGGTPSLFHPASLGRIVGAICRYFPLQPLAEVSIEANPNTIDGDYADGLIDAGVNRVSLGAQSFTTSTLQTLGRTHTASTIEVAVEALRAASFHNISLDLMYGVPGQTVEQLADDLNALIAFEPEHVSAYGLTIEKGTPFYQAARTGRMDLPEEALLLEMMALLEERLTDASYARYEISNYAREGREARHNLAYWNRQDYLGLGAGAHSYCEREPGQSAVRWSNYALPNQYMEQATAKGTAASWEDTLERKDLIFEAFFLGLRKLSGVSKAQFQEEFGLTVADAYPNMLELMTEQGLIAVSDTHVSLTERGLMLADTVIANFSEVESDLPKPWEAVKESRSSLVAINS